VPGLQASETHGRLGNQPSDQDKERRLSTADAFRAVFVRLGLGWFLKNVRGAVFDGNAIIIRTIPDKKRKREQKEKESKRSNPKDAFFPFVHFFSFYQEFLIIKQHLLRDHSFHDQPLLGTHR